MALVASSKSALIFRKVVAESIGSCHDAAVALCSNTAAFCPRVSVAASIASPSRGDGDGLRIGLAKGINQSTFFRPKVAERAENSGKQSQRLVTAAGNGTATVEGEASAPGTSTSLLELTYLEGNSWLWKVAELNILVDPVLVGNLDFGIPLLYDAAKVVLKEFKLEDLPKLDLLLITQGFDDHCHTKTLGPLSKMLPRLNVISSPNAESILKEFYQEVTYLEPGESTFVKGSNGTELKILASPGPVLGPPWQRPENGYILEVQVPKFSLYYEPHCVFNRSVLEKEEVDVVVTPVIKQVISNYTLVSGQEDAVELAKLLNARFVIPMKNGELDAKGILSIVVKTGGSLEDFKKELSKSLPNAHVLEPIPGIPLAVPVGAANH